MGRGLGQSGHHANGLAHGGKTIALRGGADTEAHFPNPPLLGRRDGRGGSGQGCPTCRAGGGGVNPTSMAQNDTHVALIILSTQMWGGGGELLVEKTFSGQILCSCAFGANIRSYTKQRARHGTPFLQPPPPPSAGVHVTPPPQSNFQVAHVPPPITQYAPPVPGPGPHTLMRQLSSPVIIPAINFFKRRRSNLSLSPVCRTRRS